MFDVSRCFALVLVGMVFTPGCREATNPPPAAVAEEPHQASQPQRADGEIVTREGELHPSKGFASVDGVLIPGDAVRDHFGDDWRKTAVGKRVRVRGKLRIHKCGPNEQCLIQGELPILTPDSIEVITP